MFYWMTDTRFNSSRLFPLLSQQYWLLHAQNAVILYVMTVSNQEMFLLPAAHQLRLHFVLRVRTVPLVACQLHVQQRSPSPAISHPIQFRIPIRQCNSYCFPQTIVNYLGLLPTHGMLVGNTCGSK